MPVLAVLFLVVMATGHRLRALGYMAVSELTTLLLLSVWMLPSAGASATAWRYILLAAVAVLAAGYLVEFFLRLPARAKAVLPVCFWFSSCCGCTAARSRNSRPSGPGAGAG